MGPPSLPRSVSRAFALAFGLAPLAVQGIQAPLAAQGIQARALATRDIQVPPPPFTEGLFPCSTCHDGRTLKPNPVRRDLKDMHSDIVLKHGPDSRWCTDCHDLRDRDRLHLANGERIEFTVSYELCGQCHGEKLRDWQAGVHGKRTGSWNGAKQYLLCVNCHNPHSPHFQPLKPMPPPVRPSAIQAKQRGAS